MANDACALNRRLQQVNPEIERVFGSAERQVGDLGILADDGSPLGRGSVRHGSIQFRRTLFLETFCPSQSARGNRKSLRSPSSRANSIVPAQTAGLSRPRNPDSPASDLKAEDEH